MEPMKEEKSIPASFPIVAIGASAGALDALKKFFNAMPAQSGIAFIVIVHLDPTHTSHLPELLGQQTTMPVSQVQDVESVSPNHVYLIPPNKLMTLQGSCLHLEEATARPHIPMPIDHFLSSLAANQQDRAVGIILSGTGSDGTLGLKEIKAAGGLVMAQQPDTAAYDGMPTNAIATGLVDRVLPVEAMPTALLDYIEHAGLHGDTPSPVDTDQQPEQLHELLALLRIQGGHDFRCYKKGMLLRRIQRRMTLGHIASVGEYIRQVRDTPAELQALVQDLLISVTAFFREPDAWEVFATEVIPSLVSAKPAGTPIRVWVAGCATGEEAYSIGMLLLEHLDTPAQHGKIQIFATDIDKQALEIARVGRYPESIAGSLSPQRLARFFTKEGNSYLVKKELREIITFAGQNLVTDAPFSRMDLISCRNLLIYLEPELQQKVISLFHFSLNPLGYLVLGKSETIGRQRGMFDLVSKRWRIYRRSSAVRQGNADFPLMSGYRLDTPEPWPVQHARNHSGGYGEFVGNLLLQRHAPASVLVNRDYQILYFYGPTDDYLIHPTGDISTDLLSMAREGLRLKLRTTLHQAVNDNAEAVTVAEVMRAGVPLPVRISVTPEEDPRQNTQFLLVSFQPATVEPASGQMPRLMEESDAIRELEAELASTKRELESTIRELDAANEEFKISHEEALSVNEELQSSNEELETSKEELQSLNEELTTVNTQLEEKIVELEGINNDLHNLIASTSLATLFLDRQFHIKRFTPACTRLFKLIPSDLNRPITDIVSQLADKGMIASAQHVLKTLIPEEREVQTKTGEWYLRRTLPYRTQDDRIEGVVMTFTDVSSSKQLETSLREHTEALHQASRYKDEFLAMLAHELRNPLAPVLNAAQLLSNKKGNDPQLITWASALIKRQTGHLAHMVDDLLDIARISQGRISLAKARTNLCQIVTDATDTLRPLADAHKLNLSLSLPTEAVPVNADATRLTQVVGNLLDNAIKYTPEDGRIELSVVSEGNEAVFRIRDTGEGIDPSLLPVLFDLFTQADRTLDRAKGGLGIGLSLVKRLVELHGGHVEVSSSGINQGSEFVVRLPLMPATEAPVPTGQAAPVSSAVPASRRILVVDDNPDVSHSFAMLLELMGHKVTTAPDGPTALAMVAASRPEVIFLDIGLPGMDGHEVARRLRQAHGAEAFKLFALSGYGREEDRQRSRQAGFDQHLIKPVELDVIEKLLTAS